MSEPKRKWCTLTTTDNPYHPYDDFENWLDYDCFHSYHTLSYLSRITFLGDFESEASNMMETERAVDEAVKLDAISLVTNGKVHYKKVYLDNP